MRRLVIDTNVPVVANGRPDPRDPRIPSIECRRAAIRFLISALESGKVLVDLKGEIQAEYRKHLNPRGQPGVGDRFYQAVINSAPNLIERIDLPKRGDGEFADLPQSIVDAGFDPSDRKFAALARKDRSPVVNATDGDWLEHRRLLARNGIKVEFVCGCEPSEWFMPRDAQLS